MITPASIVHFLAQSPERSRRVYASSIERFKAWAESTDDSAGVEKEELVITHSVLEEYQAYLKEKGYAPGSVRFHWAVLKSYCKANKIEWPWLRGDAPQLAEQDILAPILDQEIIREMIEASVKMPPDHRAYLALATTYGLRRQEMCEITQQAFNFNEKLLWVSTAKHGRQRFHAIPQEILPALQSFSFEKPYAASSLSRMFQHLKRAVNLTNAEEVGWHSIRRALTRALLMANLPEASVTTFLRWKRSSTNMARLYFAGTMITRDGNRQELGMEDRAIDEFVFKHHPFLHYWNE